MMCPLTRSAGNTLSVVSGVMGTANRVKGRAVVILRMDATHLLMASDLSDMVGMKAVPQILLPLARHLEEGRRTTIVELPRM